MSSDFDKCSIILPVKNGSKYIKRAIVSVLKQSSSNWKLIIVNDASIDETEEVIQEFLGDKRIQYISCFQGVGVSRARNIGLQEAEGKYVIFLDCDDCLTNDSITNRIEGVKANQANFGFFGSYFIKEKDNLISEKLPLRKKYPGGGILCTNREFMSRVSEFQTGKVVGIEYVWDKIFDLQIIKEQNIRFDVARDRYEDWVFVMDYLKCLKHYDNRILISKVCIYDYYIYANSVSHLFDLKLFQKTRSCFEYIKNNLEYYGIFNEKIAEGYYHGYLNKVIGQVIASQNNCYQGEFKEFLAHDKDFLEGLKRYQIRNEQETDGILNMLKETFL